MCILQFTQNINDMKKILLLSLLSFLLYSCASEEPKQDLGTDNCINIDLTIPYPDDMKTRAFGDGSYLNNLKCYIYDQAKGSNQAPYYIDDLTLNKNGGTLGCRYSVYLPKDKTYDLVFLATSLAQDDSSSKLYYNKVDRTMNVNYDKMQPNDESVDCFYGVLKGVSGSGSNSYTISLRRPFAQLNIGTKDLEIYNQLSSASFKSAGVSIDGVYSGFKVMDGSVTGSKSKVSFAQASAPTGQSFPVANTVYLSMNYLLVNEKTDVNVSMKIENQSSSFDCNFNNVPLQRNCRTNIFGNLLTGTNDYKIQINPYFGGSEDTEIENQKYDVILEVDEIVENGKIVIDLHGEGWNLGNYKIDLAKYIDSEKMIKITWEELGISQAESIQFEPYQSIVIKNVHKLDLDKIGVSDCSLLFNQQKKLETVNNLKISDLDNADLMFNNCFKLKYIDLSNVFTTDSPLIAQMFYNCQSLISVDLSNFDTHNSYGPMSELFYNCKSLVSVDLSSLDTWCINDMSGMFCGCESLTSLDLSNFDTRRVENMAGMFELCKSLTSLDLSNFDTSKVKTMNNMFYGCESLTSLDLSIFDTRNVESIIGMFGYCKSITSLDLTNFDTSNVENIDLLFDECESLSNLQISNFNTSNVSSMSGTFKGCSALKTLDLRNFDTSKVETMNNMFERCTTLTNINLSSFNTSKVANFSLMFAYCVSLTELDLSSFDVSNATDMGAMFYHCKLLNKLILWQNGPSEECSTYQIFEGCDSLDPKPSI